MSKIVAYNNDEQKFVSNVDPIFEDPFTRNVYDARRFTNVLEAERWLSVNFSLSDYTFLEVIDQI